VKYETAILNKKNYFREILIKEENVVISISLIDYLQYYDITKICENKIKSLFKINVNNSISCIDSISYGNRLLKFVESELEDKSKNQ